jgi:Protein of unknown function (DUF1186)/SEC-C motif
LIEKYPRVPILYNYLGVSYQAQGKADKSMAVTNKCYELFPDYLFAIMAKAKDAAFKGNFQKAYALLSGMNLKDLYPKRTLFFTGEVINFNSCCADILIEEGKFEEAETFLKLVDELGEKTGKKGLTDKQRQTIMFKKRLKFEAERRQQREEEEAKYNDDDYEYLEVVATRKFWVETSDSPPQFYHPQIQWLYEEGYDIPQDKVTAILNLPRQTLIEDLKKVIDDSCARFDYFYETDWAENSHNFMLHALWFLAELKAEEALSHALHILRQDADWLEYWFSDALTENLHSAFYPMGQNRLDVLKDFIKEPNNATYARNIATKVASLIVHYQPQRRQEVLDWYTDVCQFFLSVKNDETISDYGLNGCIASDIIDIKGEELFPLLKTMFDEDIVDEMVMGDWDETMKFYDKYRGELNLQLIETRTEVYADMAKWGESSLPSPKPQTQSYHQTYGYTPQSTADSLKNIKNTPRNSPCPCGSGRKYKNCHGK